MTVAAIFKSRLLKMATRIKNVDIFVTELKLQVRLSKKLLGLSMQTLHRYTLLMIQKSHVKNK